MELLTELFDSSKTYPVVDVLQSKNALPQLFLVKAPGNDNLLVRFVGSSSEGDKLKSLKKGDKGMQVFLLSLSEKGNVANLKGGLGDDPIGTMTTIFQLVLDTAKKNNMDSVLFRFPVKGLQGKQDLVKRIVSKLVQLRSGGRYIVLDELSTHGKKYAYVMMYRKTKGLSSDLQGVPHPGKNFEPVKTEVGEVYVNTDNGEKVSKAEAIASTIAQNMEKITDAAVIARTKVSRREAIAAQYSTIEDLDSFSDAEKEAFNELSANPPIYSSENAYESVTQDGIEKACKQAAYDLAKEIENLPGLGTENFSFNSNYVRNVIDDLFDGLGKMDEDVKAKLVDSKAKEIAQVIKTFDPKNIQKSIFKIAEITTTGEFSSLPKLSKVHKTKQLISHLFAVDGVLGKAIASSYKDASVENTKQYTPEQQDVIRKYTGSAYTDFNEFLTGETSAPKAIYKDRIPLLDSAFENGTKLKPGTKLYRGQLLKLNVLDKAVKAKTFYFRNYVSASLAPVIYGGYSNAYGTLDANREDYTDLSTKDMANKVLRPDWADDHTRTEEEILAKAKMSLALIISGAEKLKVIVPGELTKYPLEAEVILPRGVALKFDKIYGEAEGDRSSFDTILVESSVINPNELTESTELYDGDLLLSEGKVQKLTGLKEIYFSESSTQVYSDTMDILASVVHESFDSIPDKFKN